MKTTSGSGLTLGIAVIVLIAGLSPTHAAPVVKEIGGGEYQVTFSFKPEAGTKTVHLAGEFNGWSTSATPLTGPDADGRFTVALPLNAGRYEYKFVCDGSRWIADPDNPNSPGSYGNSVLFVGVPPLEMQLRQPPTTQPNYMAAKVSHPPEVAEAIVALADGGALPYSGRPGWLQKNLMPVFTETAVSFVVVQPADVVRLVIKGSTFESGYELEPATGVHNRLVWAISLDRTQVNQGFGYVYEIKRGDSWDRVLDPYAWSFTSRGGIPAGAVLPASDERGRIEMFPNLESNSGDLLPRDIYVYLPPRYARLAPVSHGYPVLYMHDGQNCWDDPVDPFGHGGWQVNVAADRLIREGKVRPFIVVAIANTPQRMQDYGPGTDVTDASNHAYIRFLIEDVKPMIDQRYRTLTDPANTAIMGSSMGGLISFQAAMLRPDVFGMAGVMSPAFWFKDPKGQSYDALLNLNHRGEGNQGGSPNETQRGDTNSILGASVSLWSDSGGQNSHTRPRIYLDSGTAGQGEDGAPDTRKMAAALRAAGWKDGVDLMHFEDEGAQHNERAWRARVRRPLEFMFAK